MCQNGDKHTEAVCEQHAFKEDVLSISSLVAYAYFLVFGTKAGLDKIHCTQAVWTKAYTSAVLTLDPKIYPWSGHPAHPTAENSFASSYSVNGMSLLCRAIANARPPMPAPVWYQFC